MIQSIEPGESWVWCYPDRAYLSGVVVITAIQRGGVVISDPAGEVEAEEAVPEIHELDGTQIESGDRYSHLYDDDLAKLAGNVDVRYRTTRCGPNPDSGDVIDPAKSWKEAA